MQREADFADAALEGTPLGFCDLVRSLLVRMVGPAL